MALIGEGGGTPVGIAIALDRQEVVDADATVRRSAAQSVAEIGLAVVAVARLSDLLALARESAELVSERERLVAYRSRYGCSDG